MFVLTRWNMTSCCGGASRRQTTSAIKPSRPPAVRLRAAGPAAACPAQLHCLTWRWFWKKASSPSTRLSSTRSSPASKRPKRTSARTGVQSRTAIPGTLPNDCIVHDPGTFLIVTDRRNLLLCYAQRVQLQLVLTPCLTHATILLSPVMLTHLCFLLVSTVSFIPSLSKKCSVIKLVI